ncbi:IclR family transcriptional regulator [Porphyrobacter sp. AAP60]|nr:IclR family transcriptional regulator [Porphyrobacter sp. AAP60]
MGGTGETKVKALRAQIAACTLCAEYLPLGARPVVQFSASSRLLIISQAPGTKVHASGIPFDDNSGDRLRGWLALHKAQFYDPQFVALMPMGFCYPGKASGGDAPPRNECAPQWHEAVLAEIPEERLTLLVGSHAQARYLPEAKGWSMTERVRAFGQFGNRIALPHPAWRSRIWMGKHPWFERDIIPQLRLRVAAALQDRP